MKRIFMTAVTLAIVLLFFLHAHADLYNRGTDSLGNQLIYDSDLNITWYDYTKSYDEWQIQADWAAGLDIDFGGTHFTDWRLPVSDTCFGFDCVGSELGHLFYTELDNSAGGPLTNIGVFENLEAWSYWSGTEYDTGWMWKFSLSDGYQNYCSTACDIRAIAVRSGDVAVVPEPISSILFVTGSTLLAGRRFIKRNRA